ncbi:unnamed protein product [Owenia fusiformis]|uniref:Uncharacterized protein n=1 Tax=Owenia fusiformis TaxID=6347 RepID=A0A8J1Y0U7_OWEFU|nr:unnamed protein product [Owenia fusiformis]
MTLMQKVFILQMILEVVQGLTKGRIIADPLCKHMDGGESCAAVGGNLNLTCIIGDGYQGNKNAHDITFEYLSNSFNNGNPIEYPAEYVTVVNNHTAFLSVPNMPHFHLSTLNTTGYCFHNCLIKEDEILAETMTLIGYLPEKPHNIECKMRNWNGLLEFSWQPGSFPISLHTNVTTFVTWCENCNRQAACPWSTSHTDRAACKVKTPQNATYIKFEVSIANKLKIEGNSQTFIGNPQTFIEPDPVIAKATPINSTCIYVNWTRTAPIGKEVVYDISYISKWDKNKTLRLQIEAEAIHITGLVPFTNYTIEVIVRAIYNNSIVGYPSSSSQVMTKTPEDVPGGIPTLTTGAFYEYTEGEQSYVTIYWQEIMKRLWNGVVTYTPRMVSPNNEIPLYSTSTSGTFRKTQDIQMTFEVTSATKKGTNSSLPIQRIVVHKANKRIQHPMTWMVRREQHPDQSLVIFEWSNSPYNHTAYWCHRAPGDKCQGDLQWQTLAGDTQNFSLLELGKPGNYLFGLSTEFAETSSGIQWAKCLYDTDEPPPREHPLNVIVENKQAESLQVHWSHYPCNKYDGIVQHYMIRYCRKQDCEKTTVNITVASSATQHKIEGLQGGAFYSLTLEAVTKHGKGPHTPTITTLVRAGPGLKPWMTALIVIVGFFFFGLVCLGIYFIITLLIKQEKKTKQLISVPYFTSPTTNPTCSGTLEYPTVIIGNYYQTIPETDHRPMENSKFGASTEMTDISIDNDKLNHNDSRAITAIKPEHELMANLPGLVNDNGYVIQIGSNECRQPCTGKPIHPETSKNGSKPKAKVNVKQAINPDTGHVENELPNSKTQSDAKHEFSLNPDTGYVENELPNTKTQRDVKHEFSLNPDTGYVENELPNAKTQRDVKHEFSLNTDTGYVENELPNTKTQSDAKHEFSLNPDTGYVVNELPNTKTQRDVKHEFSLNPGTGYVENELPNTKTQSDAKHEFSLKPDTGYVENELPNTKTQSDAKHEFSLKPDTGYVENELPNTKTQSDAKHEFSLKPDTGYVEKKLPNTKTQSDAKHEFSLKPDTGYVENELQNTKSDAKHEFSLNPDLGYVENKLLPNIRSQSDAKHDFLLNTDTDCVENELPNTKTQNDSKHEFSLNADTGYVENELPNTKTQNDSKHEFSLNTDTGYVENELPNTKTQIDAKHEFSLNPDTGYVENELPNTKIQSDAKHDCFENEIPNQNTQSHTSQNITSSVSDDQHPDYVDHNENVKKNQDYIDKNGPQTPSYVDHNAAILNLGYMDHKKDVALTQGCVDHSTDVAKSTGYVDHKAAVVETPDYVDHDTVVTFL